MPNAFGVQIRVVEVDVRSYATDALVLKYAQQSYGADGLVIAATGIRQAELPAPGDHLMVRTPTGLPARRVVFLGVPDISGFGYREIREFGMRALTTVARLENIREITVTLHGAGFGLDEHEAFDSEVAGIIDALRSGQVPAGLEYVTFAEISQSRADRMRRKLRRLLPDSMHVDGGLGARPNEMLAEHLRSVGYDSLIKRHAFVAMPFDGTLEDHYYYAIAPAVRAAGLLCERMDEQNFT
ncbi:MAG: hypothetical protein ACRDRV_20365, partial [Pseudonocardiaceae bacterium]